MLLPHHIPEATMTRLLSTAAIAAILLPATAGAQGTPSPTSQVIQTKAGPVTIEKLATLEHPWGMAFLPDGRLLVTEKPGRLRLYADGKLSEPITGVPKVAYRGQGGLLDVAVDPNFASNGLVYLSYAEAAEQQPANARDEGDPRFGGFGDKEDVTLKGGAVARARLDGTALRDLEVIWRQVPKMIGRGHFGGPLVFAPDGTLFILSGERMRFDPAQDMASNAGKVVRINADGSIPKDNPFVGKAGVRDDIWSSGHRNPLGGAILPASGRLWINEMGPRHGDELNVPEPGKNYGWPVVSNGDNYDGSPIPDHPARPEFAAPTFYWHPAISPSGMTFYTGKLFPDWSGNAFIGGLSSETLLRLQIKADKVAAEERIAVQRRVRDVIQGPDGAVFLLSDGPKGELLRLTPAPR
jgi:glucose/arabinose dehydrogenase